MLRYEETDGVGVLRMEHGKVNAMDVELLDALAERIAELERDGPSALVITGAGRVFSAGADLPRVLSEGRAYVERSLPALHRTFATLFAFSRPVVAAVNGHAIAGGCVLVCACDYRVMARGGGTIGLAELRVGVPFPTVGLEIVRAAVAPQHLRELVLLGDNYDPEDALGRGLVDELVEPGEMLDRSVGVARRLARIPPETFAHTKRALRRSVLEHVERVREADDARAIDLWASEPVRAAIESFLADLAARRG